MSKLIELYAGEVIAKKITEDKVPAALKDSVHKYLVYIGYKIDE